MLGEEGGSWKVECWVGTTRFGGVVLAAAVLILAAAFFLDFPAVSSGAAVELRPDFLGLAISLVAFTIGRFGVSVTG